MGPSPAQLRGLVLSEGVGFLPGDSGLPGALLPGQPDCPAPAKALLMPPQLRGSG